MTRMTDQPLTAAVSDLIVGGLPEWRLRYVTHYITQNLPRQLRLQELSAVVHMSPYHFAHLFKKSTGVPPRRFVLQRRIEEAEALLTAPEVPIAAVARSVGFRTPSHFSTTFRRFTGCTPSDYRRDGGRGGSASVEAHGPRSLTSRLPKRDGPPASSSVPARMRFALATSARGARAASPTDFGTNAKAEERRLRSDDSGPGTPDGSPASGS
jgi:AraC-like DNA-binding protein